MRKERPCVNTYALYDMKDSEQLVTIGTSKELMKFLNVSQNTFFSTKSKTGMFKRRYLVEKIEDYDDEEEF